MENRVGLMSLEGIISMSRELLGRKVGYMSRQKRREKELQRRGVKSVSNMQATSSPVRVIEGILSDGAAGKYSVNGVDFELDRTTTIYGEFKIGSYVTVCANVIDGSPPFATKIVARTL